MPSKARSAKVDQRAALARRAARRRTCIRWGATAAVVLAVVAGITFIATRGNDADKLSLAGPEVGGDLHTVTMIGDGLYVGGHEAVAVSHDGGQHWQQVITLKGADAMGWALTPDALLVGGHPGLYRSTDNGVTFAKVTGSGAVSDVHALGGAGATVYLSSPQAGLLASADGGNSWQVRNAQAGRSMMGSILVDPEDPNRLVAPDMSAGLTTSSDGGRTWKPMGGPSRAMAVAWNPTDIRQIIAVGMNGGARSSDGGGTWQQIHLPAGASAVSYDPSGKTLYVGTLDGHQARVSRSTDGGATWTATT